MLLNSYGNLLNFKYLLYHIMKLICRIKCINKVNIKHTKIKNKITFPKTLYVMHEVRCTFPSSQAFVIAAQIRSKNAFKFIWKPPKFQVLIIPYNEVNLSN